MSMREERELRMKCLELAIARNPHGKSVDLAREYTDFVLGTSDAKIIHAARDLVEKVNPGGGS